MEFERLFTISAFEGLRLMRSALANVPGMRMEDCPAAIIAHAPEAAGYDLVAAMHLHGVVTGDARHETVAFYRECIISVLLLKMPAFAKLMTRGRGRFIGSIQGDEYRDIQSVFREARVLDDPPTDEDVAWWDTIQGRVRLNTDQEFLARARVAEKLTLEYEAAELAKLGIDRSPVWMAIEDNFVGYDVLSYRNTGEGVQNLLIEVKSTVASPLRFIVTRNEWNNADKVGEAYLFYVWNLDRSPAELFIRTVAQVRPHIPEDNEKGKWKTAEIPVGI